MQVGRLRSFLARRACGGVALEWRKGGRMERECREGGGMVRGCREGGSRERKRVIGGRVTDRILVCYVGPLWEV